MSTIYRPGFWPVRTLSGAPLSGKLHRHDVTAGDADMGIGDVVEMGTDSNVKLLSSNTAAIVGVIVGVLPVTPPRPTATLALSGNTAVTLGQKYSSAAGPVLVCYVEDVVFEAQGESGVAFTRALHVGETINTNIAGRTVDTTTGLSTMCLAAVTNGTAAAAQWKIVDIVERPDNDTSANTKVLVVCNDRFFANQIAGV